jgi:glycosyltransferase involved in cell wall biosynthesis
VLDTERLHYTFLMPLGGFGGLEIQTVQRAADAIRRDEGSLLVSHPGSRSEKYAESLNVPVARLRIRHQYLNLLAACKLAGFMKTLDSKVCIVSTTQHLSVAILARNLFLPGQAVILYQQLQFSRNKKDPFHNWVYRNIDGAIVLTEKMRNTLSDKTVLPRDKIRVIPYGIDLEAFAQENHDRKECRATFGIPQDRFVIGLIGRIEPSKGQRLAVEAFADAGIPNSMLVMAGNIGFEDYFQSLKDLSKERGIEKGIHFLPFTHNVPKLMNAFDISVLPSMSEAFGLVVIEAMASSLPVVATDAGGVPGILSHGKNGLLFPPGDTHALAGHMRLLAEDGSLRERLGHQAWQDANKRYVYRKQSDEFFRFCGKTYCDRNRH